MSQSGFDETTELQQRLEAEISRRQELEVLVTEKESEVECAVSKRELVIPELVCNR